MLQKRIREDKSTLKAIAGPSAYENLMKDYGEVFRPHNLENQREVNLMIDINQTEFLIWCLKNKRIIEGKRLLMLEKE